MCFYLEGWTPNRKSCNFLASLMHLSQYKFGQIKCLVIFVWRFLCRTQKAEKYTDTTLIDNWSTKTSPSFCDNFWHWIQELTFPIYSLEAKKWKTTHTFMVSDRISGFVSELWFFKLKVQQQISFYVKSDHSGGEEMLLHFTFVPKGSTRRPWLLRRGVRRPMREEPHPMSPWPFPPPDASDRPPWGSGFALYRDRERIEYIAPLFSLSPFIFILFVQNCTLSCLFLCNLSIQIIHWTIKIHFNFFSLL